MNLPVKNPNKSKSFEELLKFTQNVKDKKELQNGDLALECTIKYLYKKKEIVDDTCITIQGFTKEGGHIIIEDGEKINSEKMHTKFSPNYQKYILNKSGHLIVTGKSAKIKDYYKIVLIPKG